MSPRARAVLNLWFSEAVISNQLWFKSDAGFDQDVRKAFSADHMAAGSGAYDTWLEQAESALALTILLDQFPRNMYRGTARAFETDAKAQSVADIAVAHGFDHAVSADRRVFFYMPFEHAEDFSLQERSVQLITDLNVAEFTRYAERHAEIIRRFGRFPHRNAILGRRSTPDELAYLAEHPNEFG